MKRLENMANGMRMLVLLFAAWGLQACSMGGELLKESESAATLTKDEVILVGTIELSPKLAGDEQELDPPGVIDVMGFLEKNRNHAMIQLNSKAEVDDYKMLITPELGQTFFFTVPREMAYMVEGSIIMEYSTHGVSSKIVLPTWFKLDIKPSDKAIYIGKIVYKRDDFNSVVDMKLVDDYTNATKQFKKKFGSQTKLRKSLIKKL